MKGDDLLERWYEVESRLYEILRMNLPYEERHKMIDAEIDVFNKYLNDLLKEGSYASDIEYQV